MIFHLAVALLVSAPAAAQAIVQTPGGYTDAQAVAANAAAVAAAKASGDTAQAQVSSLQNQIPTSATIGSIATAAANAVLKAANPLTGIAPGAAGHLTATKLDATATDAVMALNGDASGTAAQTAVAVQRPAYTSVAVTAGATVQLPAGFAYYDLTASGLIAAATVRLPPNPQDKQLARLIATGPLQITMLTVQDANGNAVGSALGVGLLGTALYQFQGTAWQRVGT